MSAELARQRYLQRHIEPGLPPCPPTAAPWQHVLVIPAYREAPDLLQHLQGLPPGPGRTLVILVLNRPDSDPDREANRPLREAAAALPACGPGLQALGAHSDLYLHDLDLLSGPVPASQGVGLARKIGCDIAFKWLAEGAIEGRWICCTDADALLPPDYFRRLAGAPAAAGAAIFPFRHAPGNDPACNAATALYEARLHHYVLGLENAGSPYACHTLGSCLAVTVDAYAQVRGIPRRAGAEDFYFINKLAKVAPLARLAGTCIDLQSRESGRVPFGTGPAVARISAAPEPQQLPLFYHPACFEALGGLLRALPLLAVDPAPPLRDALLETGLQPALAAASAGVLERMQLAPALAHCRRQGTSAAQFARHFHQWFDAFRTLKLVHGLRDAGWPLQSLDQLRELEPRLWPGVTEWQAGSLNSAARGHWGWSTVPAADGSGQVPAGHKGRLAVIRRCRSST